MNEEHIILRAPLVTTRDIFLGEASPTSTGTLEARAAGITVDVEKVSRRDLSDLARSTDVVAIAPTIPMKLVEPLDGQNVLQPATPHVAGVAALWAEKLRGMGSLAPTALTARLIASGVTTNQISGFDPFDVGTGMARAPQS